MSLLYTYGTGSIVSNRYSEINDLLFQLPDNNTNAILAADVRDSVFTLWERANEIQIISNSASIAASASTFMNPNPTMVTVGGITASSTFPTPKTVQQLFDIMLYPYTQPIISMGSIADREYGSPLSVNITWSIIEKSYPISSKTINSVPVTSSPSLFIGTHSLSPGISEINTFTMSVTDTMSNITTSSTSLTWMNKIYWGTIDLSSLSNPNLTISPTSSVDVTNYINSGIILGLTNSELSTTKNNSINDIGVSGEYLIFAWPSNVLNAYTPKFTVNGMHNTAFTRVKTNWTFINSFGFSCNYEVWVSNTEQYSTISSIIIS